MHPRVTRNSGIPSFCQRSADRNIARRIEVHSPSMDPDYRDGLGDILRRSEKCSCIDDVIFGLDMDELLCEFSCLLVLGLLREASPDRNSCTYQSKDCGNSRNLRPCFQILWSHRLLPPSTARVT